MSSPALALLLANARYWPTVAPRVGRQLTRWERAAAAIGDPGPRAMALAKLRDEHFNVQLATTLATLAPRRRRAEAIEAIVALQVMYDYLDLLGEQPPAGSGRDQRGLFAHLIDSLDLSGKQPPAGPERDRRGPSAHPIDAVSMRPAGASTPFEQPPGDEQDEQEPSVHPIDAISVKPAGASTPFEPPPSDEDRYLEGLGRAVRLAFARLPAAAAVAGVAREAAERCAQAQILHHEASRSGAYAGGRSGYTYAGGRSGTHAGSQSGARSGIVELRDWATAQAAGTGLGWQEALAGSTASVLAIHALIAAAADPRTTREDAAELDRAYLSIGALTMLDSLVDREEDIATGQLSYVDLYGDPEEMAGGLARVARDGLARARGLANGAHHAMTLVGVVSYYASAPGANDDPEARAVIARVERELAPLITPTLALMRAWRMAKHARRGGSREPPHRVLRGVRDA
jgi:Protein of unknown function (DUF2600)